MPRAGDNDVEVNTTSDETGNDQGNVKLEAYKTSLKTQATTLRKAQSALGEARKKQEVYMREKESLSLELRRTQDVKDKLENLCRELQRTQKATVMEARTAAVLEATKREELTARFEGGLKDISARLDEHGGERSKHIQEIQRLTERCEMLATFQEKSALAADLERQLSECKLREAAEKLNTADARLAMADQRIQALSARELELTGQIEAYSEKFGEFHNTIKESNEAFGGFKADLDRLSKALKASEKEKAALLAKIEKSDVALFEILEKNAEAAKSTERAHARCEKMEGLCRTLQMRLKEAESQLAPINGNVMPGDVT